MTGDDAAPTVEVDHETVEKWTREEMEWPKFYVSGEGVDAEHFVPAYYRVEGPNGPVSHINPDGEAQPTTMFDFAMEAQSDHFRFCTRGETPWGDSDGE